MNSNSTQLPKVLRDFNNEIQTLKIEQKDLLFRVKKTIDLVKLKNINKKLGK